MSKKKWFAVGVATVLIVAVALFLRGNSVTVDAPAPASLPVPVSLTPPDQTAHSAPAAAPKKAVPPAQDLVADFGLARPDLERKAAAGDREAALRLGRVMVTCDGYKELTDEQMETQIVDKLARFATIGQQLMDAKLDAGTRALLLKAQHEKWRQACAGANGLQLDAAQRAQALAWLRQAADAGSTSAMLAYAEHAFDEYKSTSDLMKAAEEVRQRKQIARDYLQRAAAAGDTGVFALRAAIHETGGVLPKDAMAAYANYYAFVRSQGTSPEAEWMLRNYAFDIDEEEQQRAEQIALQWLAHCCVETGLGP